MASPTVHGVQKDGFEEAVVRSPHCLSFCLLRVARRGSRGPKGEKLHQVSHILFGWHGGLIYVGTVNLAPHPVVGLVL